MKTNCSKDEKKLIYMIKIIIKDNLVFYFCKNKMY